MALMLHSQIGIQRYQQGTTAVIDLVQTDPPVELPYLIHPMEHGLQRIRNAAVLFLRTRFRTHIERIHDIIHYPVDRDHHNRHLSRRTIRTGYMKHGCYTINTIVQPKF